MTQLVVDHEPRRVLGTGSVPTTPVSLPVASVADHERFEGMLVDVDADADRDRGLQPRPLRRGQPLRRRRLYNPTAVALPGAPAQAVAAQNNLSRIVLDDANNQQNLDPTRYPTGGLSADEHASGRRHARRARPACSSFRFWPYRIQPVGAVDFIGTNLRHGRAGAGGRQAEGRVLQRPQLLQRRRAGRRLPDLARRREPVRVRPPGGEDRRGAEGDRRRHRRADGDRERRRTDSAIAELVDALNAATAPARTRSSTPGVIGTDAIKVALIYKPAAVDAGRRVGRSSPRRTTRASSTRSTGRRWRRRSAHYGSARRLTVVVNHLKSKGSACVRCDPDHRRRPGQLQRHAHAAAEALADWLATDPTGSGDPDFLIIGDLNSYTSRRRSRRSRRAGTTNLVAHVRRAETRTRTCSTASPATSTTPSATRRWPTQVTGVTEWHINPDEPTVLDYNTNFKTPNHVTTLYAPGPYRSSDHDPVIVGVQLNHVREPLRPHAGVRRQAGRRELAVRQARRGRAGRGAGHDNRRSGPAPYVQHVEQAGKSGKLTTAEAEHLLALVSTL